MDIRHQCLPVFLVISQFNIKNKNLVLYNSIVNQTVRLEMYASKVKKISFLNVYMRNKRQGIFSYACHLFFSTRHYAI